MDLWLYEEVLLLALRDEEGTLTGTWVTQALAGAIMADLLLEGRVAWADAEAGELTKMVEDDLRGTTQNACASDPVLHVVNPKGVGDALIDEALQKIADANRAHPISHWVSWIANTRNFTQRAAERLVDRGILKSEAQKVFFFFSREVFPELNPKPEQEIIARIRSAVVNPSSEIDDHTRVLITLARSSGLIEHNLGKDFVAEHRDQIDALIEDDVTGKATQQVIRSAQMALLAATTMTTVIVPTIIT